MRQLFGLAIIVTFVAIVWACWPSAAEVAGRLQLDRPTVFNRPRGPQPTQLPPQEATEKPNVPETPVPRVTTGQRVVVRLSEPPAARYLSAKPDSTDAFYRDLVRELSHGQAVYDADLALAAREFVIQDTELGQSPPSDVREFLVTGVGALAADTLFQHVKTTNDTDSALRKAIESVVQDRTSGTGPLHIGVGEVLTPGGTYSRQIGVVGTRLPIDIAPLARAANLRQTIHIRGHLRAAWHEISAIVLRPDGTMDTVQPTINGDDVQVAIETGNRVGALEMQLVGSGPEGPGKLVQVRIDVGQSPPREASFQLAPDETAIQTADAASAYAFTLVNSDRKEHGLAALQWDAQLSVIAREHSADMRDHNFFGHQSPSTGLHVDRMRVAGYRSVASAENLAHNISLFEAERGLMHSLGHRRNLLDPDVTHIGLGAAGSDDVNGHRRWWITQLFAKPVRNLDLAAAVEKMRADIDALRKTKDQTTLEDDAQLNAVAKRAAEAGLQGKVDSASALALQAAKDQGLLHGKLRAWAASLPAIDQLKLPDIVQVSQATRLGIGVAQDPRSADGRVAVVLLVAD